MTRRDRAVDRIRVREIVAALDREAAERLARKIREPAAEVVHEVAGGLRLEILVVVAGIEIPAERGPVVAHDPVCRLPENGQDVEPEKHGPEPVLLPDVVRSRASAFLSAQGNQAGVEQVREVLPAGGGSRRT